MSTIRFKEQSTTPADAAVGQIQMYAKTDGKLYTKQGSKPDVSPRDREVERRASLGSAYRPDEEDLDFGARDRD